MYAILKIIHIVSVISWMAGLFYLPRLFVYHVEEAVALNVEPLFLKMQKKLYTIIMFPAMIVTYISGFLLGYEADFFKDGWIHLKLLFVILLTLYHFYLKHCHEELEQGRQPHTGKIFRMINEIPTIILIIIVALVVIKF